MDTWTNLNIMLPPVFSIKTQTTSSVMLPKLALRRPPTVSLVYFATSSVTKDTRSANGISAARANANVHAWPQSWCSGLASTASGTKTSRTLRLLPMSTCDSEERRECSPDAARLMTTSPLSSESLSDLLLWTE